jgi:hypothetical protein
MDILVKGIFNKKGDIYEKSQGKNTGKINFRNSCYTFTANHISSNNEL